jgi:hypothetical protein
MAERALGERLTVDQFIAWAMAQERGRYGLLDGKVYAMAPERWGMRAPRRGYGKPWIGRSPPAVCRARPCRTA